jgi:hypothetical protein
VPSCLPGLENRFKLDPRKTIVDESSTTVTTQSLAYGARRKRSVQYSLFQGGDCDEDYNLPTKRLKTLQTSVCPFDYNSKIPFSFFSQWNCSPAPSSEASRYLSEQMLELSRISRRTIAARVRYQRLRSHELDLIKSLLQDETELSQKTLTDIDFQIGTLRNVLQDDGVTEIGNKGSLLDPSERDAVWCESSTSDAEDGLASVFDGSSAACSPRE